MQSIESLGAMSPRIRLVMQSRMSSSRLPAKAMLLLGGMPLVALAALRAAASGFDFVLATSTDAADDMIVSEVTSLGLRVSRGSLDDVLTRFVDVTNDLADEDIAVRLTGDNPLPDANFIRQLVGDFISLDADYLSTEWPADGLPYGLSCEIIRTHVLRTAAASATTAFDREHVTPWIRRRYHVRNFPSCQGRHTLAQVRATIDNIDDYLRMARAFKDLADPVNAPWETIAQRLLAALDTPKALVPTSTVGGVRRSRMVLGTAQLGMPYGICNRSGQPTADESVRIIRTAVLHGVTDLDTARAYGESEARIGVALANGRANDMRVITKLGPLSHLSPDANAATVDAVVEASVLRSCRELGLASLPVLLLHRVAHLSSHGGRVWLRLKQLRNEGVIGVLGVSLQSPEEGFLALQTDYVGHIQLPCNLLDWRWESSGFAAAVAQRTEILVHARSVFLQGLIAASAEAWPSIKDFSAATSVAAIHDLVRRYGRSGADDLALAYLRGLPWIHGIVVGMESEIQLLRNLELFATSELNREQCAEVRAIFSQTPVDLLDPSRWPKK
jgi:spore coat polysaccharide biosynthesis protein SpsF